MPSAIRELTEIQISREIPRGTSGAATRKILATGATYRNQETFKHFTEHMHGLRSGPTQAPVLVQNHTEFEVRMPLDFEQLLWPLSGLKGAVSPSSPGSGEARSWGFSDTPTVDPEPNAYTLEFVERSFADRAEMEATYVLCSGFEISVTNEGIAELVAEFFGRKTEQSTYTSGLSLPTITHAASPKWSITVDDSGAAWGNTVISAQIRGFTLRCDTGLRPGRYLDGRSDLDFSQYEFGPRSMDLTMEVVHDPAAAKFVQTEEAKKTAGTMRWILLSLTGEAFDAPDAAYARRANFSLAMYHADDSMEERGADVDGNLITSVHLVSAYDSVTGFDFAVSVRNNLTAFP